MKKIRKIGMVAIILGLLLTLVQTVSAASIGADYSMFGIELGWVLVGFGAVVLIIVGVFFDKKVLTKVTVPMVALILIGGFISFAQVAEPSVEVVPGLITGWSISGTAGSSRGLNDTANWDDTADPTMLTMQINHNIDGNNMNEFTEDRFQCNFSCNPTAGVGADTTKLVTLHYKTDYLMEYEGELVLEKSGNNILANWSNENHEYDYYEGSIDMTIDETNWIRCYYNLDGGNDTVGDEFETVGESMSWTVTLWDDYGWTDTYTMMLIVISTD